MITVRYALPGRPCRTLLEGFLLVVTTVVWFSRVIFLHFFFFIVPFVSIAITKPVTISCTKTSIFTTALIAATTIWGWPRLVCDSTRRNSNIPKLSTQKKTKKIICWKHNSSLVSSSLKYRQILTYLSRFAAALFLASCILSLLFKRATMFSAFFLTLSPTSFPLGSTYSKLESAFNNQSNDVYVRKCYFILFASTVENCKKNKPNTREWPLPRSEKYVL